MFETIGTAFFAALARAAEIHLEAGHPCIRALRDAGDGVDPAATARAQEALSSLAPAIMNAIMADAHRAMREDGSVILGAWRPTGASH